MRSEWIPRGDFKHILAALTPENRLACEVSLATGLRITDVLALTPERVRKQRFTIREQKTGKTRTVRLPNELTARCLACAGQHYVFEHRTDGRQHRTRQAGFSQATVVLQLSIHAADPLFFSCNTTRRVVGSPCSRKMASFAPSITIRP